jgi:competence ComEA-like helix-hairpin-helix protein
LPSKACTRSGHDARNRSGMDDSPPRVGEALPLAVMLLALVLAGGTLAPLLAPKGDPWPVPPAPESGSHAESREAETRRVGVGTALRTAEGGSRTRVAPGKSPPGVTLDLNTATAEQLRGLPGIGSALAERIVANREIHGPFQGPEDLLRVPGIGLRRWERIRHLVRVTGVP